MRTAIATLVFTAAAAAGARSAEACSCAPPPPPAEAYESAAAVFVGSIVSKESGGERGRRIEVRAEVEQWFKGEGGERAALTTASSSAMCGYPFEEERSYLIYAGERDSGELSVSLCSRTRPVSKADDDLEVLPDLAEGRGDSAPEDVDEGDADEGDADEGDADEGDADEGDADGHPEKPESSPGDEDDGAAETGDGDAPRGDEGGEGDPDRGQGGETEREDRAGERADPERGASSPSETRPTEEASGGSCAGCAASAGASWASAFAVALLAGLGRRLPQFRSRALGRGR